MIYFSHEIIKGDSKMNTQLNITNSLVNIIRWIAKVWSVVSALFVLIFIIGYALTPEESLPKFREWLEFALFPTGVILGQLLAWKKERLGGIITVGSFMSFYLVELIIKGRFPRGPYFALVAVPGLLFLICQFLSHTINIKNTKA